MSYLLLTILCSTSIAVILKINANNNGNSIQLLTGNYFSASIIGLFLLLSNTQNSYELELIPMGLFLSFLFVGSIYAFSKSVYLSGAALSTVSSRLSVFVPIILSIIFFNEIPDEYQYVGLFLTLLTILLFYLSVGTNAIQRDNRKKFIYLLAILLGIGIADFFMKVFQENWAASEKPWFLLWIFFFAFLITLAIAIRQGNPPNKFSLLIGIVMGVPNIFSSYFLIDALKEFSAVLVYPVVNLGIIVGTAIIVKIIWDEQWNTYAKFALLTGMLAIVLLSL